MPDWKNYEVTVQHSVVVTYHYPIKVTAYHEEGAEVAAIQEMHKLLLEDRVVSCRLKKVAEQRDRMAAVEIVEKK